LRSRIGAHDQVDDNSEENCTPTGVIFIDAGFHNVTLITEKVTTYGSLRIRYRSVWALFVPFGSEGTTPDD
jgi:hypothetical protein